MDVTKTILLNKIARSEERMLLALDAANIGVWEWDSNSDIFIKDNKVLENLGLQSDDLILIEHFLSLVDVDTRTFLEEKFFCSKETNTFKYEFSIDGGKTIYGSGKVYVKEDYRRIIGVILPLFPCLGKKCRLYDKSLPDSCCHYKIENGGCCSNRSIHNN